MNLYFTASFVKQYKKQKDLQSPTKRAVEALCMASETSGEALRGKYGHYRVIALSKTQHLIYRHAGKDRFVFVAIGNSDELFL